MLLNLPRRIQGKGILPVLLFWMALSIKSHMDFSQLCTMIFRILCGTRDLELIMGPNSNFSYLNWLPNFKIKLKSIEKFQHLNFPSQRHFHVVAKHRN